MKCHECKYCEPYGIGMVLYGWECDKKKCNVSIIREFVTLIFSCEFFKLKSEG
jgi:hypothetical protein